MMTASEIAKRLRALADEITMGTVAVSAPAAPAAAEGNGLLVGVAFWDVKQKYNGDPYASLKTMDGDVYKVWDVPLLKRLDPLMRGDTVQITFRSYENKKTGAMEKALVTAVKVGGGQQRGPRPQAVTEDEIPF